LASQQTPTKFPTPTKVLQAMFQYGIIHIANIVWLACYSVKNVKTLRWLSTIGLILLIPYYLAWHLYAATVWDVAFLAINVVRLKNLYQNKTP
jgi:hypothetical protein